MSNSPPANPPDRASDEYRRLLEEAARHSAQHDRSKLSPVPVRGLVVLTCMDARIEPAEIFGFRTGDVHVIRNAGGLATDDAIRSLVISQRLLGTREVIVMNHTGCGLMSFTDDSLREALTRETGQGADLRFGTFADLEANVREQVAKIRSHPWLKPVPVHGTIYEVESGRVREVP